MKKERKAKGIEGPFKLGNIEWASFFKRNRTQSIYLDKEVDHDFSFTANSHLEISKVFLHTNCYQNSWRFVELTQKNANNFSKRIKFKKCGLFYFKLLYQLTGDRTYYWENQPYTRLTVEPKDSHNLNLYTYIPNISGNISNWVKDFTKIKELGFNTVHILPFTALDTSESPYSAKDLFQIEPSYLEPSKTKNEKKQIQGLIKACLDNSLKLCVDLVFNHIGITSNIALKKPHWLQVDPLETNGLKRAGCWHYDQWIKWNDLALIDFEHPDENIKNEIWEYMISYALFWAEIADQTNGIIRLDNLHSTNFLFIEKALAAVKSEFPNLIIQAELFADDYAINKYLSKCNINLMLATPWLSPYAADFRNQIINLHKIYDEKRYLFPVNSHDSDSVSEMYGGPEAIIPRYASTALMGTGCSGMVQGAEYGVLKKMGFIGIQNRMEFDEIPDIKNKIKIINQTKNNFKTFQTGQNLSFIDNENSAVLACIRYGKQFNEPDFIIITNFNNNGQQSFSLNLNQLENKSAKNLFTNEIISLDTLRDSTLTPYQTLILEIQAN